MSKSRLIGSMVIAGLIVSALMLGVVGEPGRTAFLLAEDARPPVVVSMTDTLFLPFVARNLTPQIVASYPNCRFGVSAWQSQMAQFDIVANLYTGSYLDFGARLTPPGPARAEFLQMLRISQDRGGSRVCGPDYGYTISPTLTENRLGAIVAANPGAVWIIGNEPDRVGQDGTCPQQYAEAYHAAYHFIKGRDPTARVAVAGLVNVTPARLQYLDIVLNTYLERYGAPMPVDVWTAHVYILSETGDGDADLALGTDPALAIPFSFDCADPHSICHAENDDFDLFVDQIVAMRRWMRDRGYRDRPLLITEYGLLKPYHYYGTCTVEVCPPGGVEGCFCDENNETFHPRRVADYMEATFDYFLTATDPTLGYPADANRLVQQWYWFSLAVDPPAAGHCSNLVDPAQGYALTEPGERWRDYVYAIPPEVDLFIDRVPLAVGHAIPPAGTVTVTLRAEIDNHGNTAPRGLMGVTFYADAALSVPIGSAWIDGPPGCGGRRATAAVAWPDLGVGYHSFWVRIDGTSQAVEGLAFVGTQRQFLPLIRRG